MLIIYVNRKDITEIKKNNVLIGYIEKKGDRQRELDLTSNKYRVVVNEA